MIDSAKLDSRHLFLVYVGVKGEQLISFSNKEGFVELKDREMEKDRRFADAFAHIHATVNEQSDLRSIFFDAESGADGGTAGMGVLLPCADHGGRIGGVVFAHVFEAGKGVSPGILLSVMADCSEFVGASSFALGLANLAFRGGDAYAVVEQYMRYFHGCIERVSSACSSDGLATKTDAGLTKHASVLEGIRHWAALGSAIAARETDGVSLRSVYGTTSVTRTHPPGLNELTLCESSSMPKSFGAPLQLAVEVHFPPEAQQFFSRLAVHEKPSSNDTVAQKPEEPKKGPDPKSEDKKDVLVKLISPSTKLEPTCEGTAKRDTIGTRAVPSLAARSLVTRMNLVVFVLLSVLLVVVVTTLLILLSGRH